MAQGKYIYPQLVGGYRWNALQQLLRLNIGFTTLYDTRYDGGEIQTTVITSAELSPTDKARLDALMASNPQFPPTPTGVRFKVKDLWDQKTAIEAAMGQPFDIWYSESVPGSGVNDVIELHFQPMNNAQKNVIRSAFASLIVED